ncbi:hypothetical protein LXM25_26275 [Dyadobacter sp. LJ53]|uniref:hypothetical protein n=1 Tax=Dyadobacter chenwenxiniae TaxID=2906456 RepID=UPI001F30A2B5|nr:hypothetical protein [Dyadobacter chenwenxiniae]MCF0053607.1 hypothetical protein [Dyadobacter chenwenxiniae]
MKYLSVVLLLFVIVSCKKTEIEQAPEFPSTVYLNRISIKSKTRLYSNKKEITDNDVIDRFLKSNGGLIIKDSSFVSDEHIKFFSPDSAKFSSSDYPWLITKNNDQLKFKSTNTWIVTNNEIRNIEMSKYRSEFEPVWDSKFRTYNMQVGYGNYSELSLSSFEYMLVSWTYYDPEYSWFPGEGGLYKSSGSGTRFNEFDESFVQHLGKGDTLAIREYFYSFKKR